MWHALDGCGLFLLALGAGFALLLAACVLHDLFWPSRGERDETDTRSP